MQYHCNAAKAKHPQGRASVQLTASAAQHSAHCSTTTTSTQQQQWLTVAEGHLLHTTVAIVVLADVVKEVACNHSWNYVANILRIT